jgi:predicted lipoprotein
VIDSERRPMVTLWLWIVAPIALVAILRPWTIRPLEAGKPASFDAEAFASSAWSRIVREASQSATDAAEMTAPGATSTTQPRFVKGTGVVETLDRQSRVGVMKVRLTVSRPTIVAIQVGPVIRGTALRDAASFIHFSDFKNQFDYAGAANALNDYVLRAVVAPLPIDTMEGRTITFTGAVSKSPTREDGAIEIVPVALQIVEAPAR